MTVLHTLVKSQSQMNDRWFFPCSARNRAANHEAAFQKKSFGRNFRELWESTSPHIHHVQK